MATTPSELMATTISGWVLVAFLTAAPDEGLARRVTPVTTNLTFPDLPSCLAAEEEMRRHWSDHWNAAKKAGMGKETLDMILGQTTSGTCIPHRVK